ncbi:uncharacterized protein LOC120009532 [Tripterygium wilfordii]|uniref:uncharacterized protein LOC120009532 n=1 Tax=Tripterygium wilfordii TaxID=458696 RepID=UPI0018F85F9F|nr:uncharacterized protein LOC120009532 [Tripterygium wilfordii]
MSERRTFVVIFFFWAVLTIVTPTLILLSESSKSSLDCNGLNARRMMVGSQQARKTLAPAPAPAPAPYPGTVNQSDHDQPASGKELRGTWPPFHCQKSELNLNV